MKFVPISLCVFILFSNLIQKCLAQRALLTIVKGKCITGSSSALAPIYDLHDSLWDKPEKFSQNVKLVVRKNNVIKFCEDPSSCFDNTWIVQNSLYSSRINNLITDRRWEELPIFLSKHVETSQSYMFFDEVMTIEYNDNFVLPLSILISQEAHLFLCEGSDVSSSACYWFMIDAWGGKYSAIRVCDAKNIRKIYDGGRAPSGLCGDSTDDYKLPTKLLSKSKWTHFKITVNKNELQLIDENGKVLIDAKSLRRKISPRHVIIHSKRVNGMWKMHDFNYYYSSGKGTTQPFALNVGSGQQCLSMFVVMCNKCTLKIETLVHDYIWYKGRFEKVLGSNVLRNDWGEHWQEHKIQFTTEFNAIYFRIIKSGPNQNSNFWAVSDIRTCETNELRIAQIDDQRKWTEKCQHLATGEVLELNEQKIEKLENWNRCNEYQFGEDCVSCKTIFGQNLCPQQSKYCQLVTSKESNSVHKKCYCSIGFDGSSCQDYCSVSKYGHGCQKNCTNCQDSCSMDPISGRCDSNFCTDNFLGKKCDQPSVLFIFSQTPIIEPRYTSCNLTIKSFDGSGDQAKMQFYRFQYRKVDQNVWRNTSDIEFNYFKTVEISELEKNSIYKLRVFGYNAIEDIDEIGYLENYIPTYTFRTTCRDLHSDDIRITTEAYSATIAITKVNDEDLCDIQMYTYNVNATVLYFSKWKTQSYIANLRPFSIYILRVSKNNTQIVVKQFRTNESAPGKPEEFKYEKDHYGFIILKWQTPKEINGNLIYYSIFEKVEFKACNFLVKTKTFNVSGIEEQFQIPDLKPYATYSFSIRAYNLAGFGEPANLSLDTPMKEKPDDEEFPKFSITSDITRVELDFSLVDCQKLTGPLKIKFKVIGTDPWCNTTRNGNRDLSEKLIISNLNAYCSYDLTLQYFRDDTFQKEEIIKFKTKEAIPFPVNELLVTSKGPNYFSLRWLPPYPPTGQLEIYKIYAYSNLKYWKYFKFEKMYEILPEFCKLWSEYHCATIIVDNKDFIYQLKVSAKNQGNSEFSEEKSINKQAQESTPGKPYGLSYSWTSENFLNLEWFLPNETNGKLTGFDILINEFPDEYNLTSQEEYKLKYKKMIQNDFELPKEYIVNIRARNLAGISDPSTIFIEKSPPPIPQNSIKNIERTENSLTVTFNEGRTSMNYQQFFYGLITECDSCDIDLIKFKNDLINYHSLYNDVESKTTVLYWRRIISHKYSNPLEKFIAKLVISNDTISYAIKKSTTYVVSFIWLNKHDGFVRSKFILEKSKGESSKHSDAGIGSMISGLFILLIVVVILATIAVRYRVPLINNARRIFTIHEQEHRITDSSISLTQAVDEPKYVNRQELKAISKKSGKRESRHIRPLSIIFTEEMCPGVPHFKTTHSKRIKLEDFREYVKQAIKSGELNAQHAKFPRGQTKPWDYGKLPENKNKNRYQNLIAYDHSRVVLNKIDGDEFSDYINANFIDGYQRPKAYIATQGPKPKTVVDFWRMIWQEKVTHIVMMANVIEGNKKKTEQYWPNVNEEVSFGDYKITFIGSDIGANYEYRKFELQFKYSKPRQVGQLHFKVWPDHGVPLYPQSLVPFLQKLLTLRSWDFPLVVHCSAGVGRTGTIILCDICLRMAASEGSVDIFGMLEHLRNQRPNLVDNIEQYKLAHLVILNCLMGLNSSIPIDENFENSVKTFKNIEYQLNYIRDCEWEDDAMKTVSFFDNEELPFDPTKNRLVDIIPDKSASVFLLPIPTEPYSGYINAVHVDGFCHPSRFIVTQFPLPHTIGDFWRLIAEKDISVVICLNEIPINDPTCKLFWPKQHKSLVFNDIIHVKHVQNKNLQFYSIMNFELSSYYEHRGIEQLKELYFREPDDVGRAKSALLETMIPNFKKSLTRYLNYLKKKTLFQHLCLGNNAFPDNETKEVQILKYHGWNYPDTIIDHTDFFTFVEDAIMIGRNSNQLLVTCYDGATASGLFIAMSFLIEKIKLEQECDVCQAVRTIRTSRKQFCNNREQLQFLYKASILYVQERFQTYSNINMKK